MMDFLTSLSEERETCPNPRLLMKRWVLMILNGEMRIDIKNGKYFRPWPMSPYVKGPRKNAPVWRSLAVPVTYDFLRTEVPEIAD